MKTYLCLITANEYDNIEELTRDLGVDGIIAVVDSKASADSTAALLEERKGEGAVIRSPWTNDHDLQMNVFLRQGPMKNQDFFFLRDSMERFETDFGKNLKNFSRLMVNQGVQSVYSHNKSFGHVFYDDMVFFGSPHYGLHNARGNAIDLKNHFPKERDYAYRLHDGEEGGRPPHNFIDHEAKYYFVYGRSNHLLLGREQKQDEYRQMEADRVEFRLLLEQKYKVPYTIHGLLKFFRETDWESDEKVLKIVKSQPILKTFIRWHILNHNLEDINKDRMTWEYDQR